MVGDEGLRGGELCVKGWGGRWMAKSKGEGERGERELNHFNEWMTGWNSWELSMEREV